MHIFKEINPEMSDVETVLLVPKWVEGGECLSFSHIWISVVQQPF